MVSPDPSQTLESHFQVINRALRVLSTCTQAVVRATDETRLLQEVCQSLVEVGGYHLSWVGYALDDAEKTVRPIAYAGYQAGYLESLQITWADTERGQGPTGRAIRAKTPWVAQNMLTDPNFAPWRAEALRRGYQSSVAVPLLSGDRVLGTLNIYSTQAYAFNPEEVELLKEFTDSLCYGILTLRAKQEQIAVEQALRLSEEKFAKAFYNSPLANSITSLETGLHIDVNYSFEWMFGYTHDEVIGKTGIELGMWQEPRDRQYLRDHLRTYGQLKDYEVRLKNRCNEPLLCRICAELIQVENRICILATIENVTQQRQAEALILQLNQELESRVQQRTLELTEATQRLEKLNQELQRSNQELEQFAYVASHDLQEPLRAVTGYTQLLLNEYGDRFDDTAQSYADFVVDGAKRMQQLIQDLLAYSRVGTRGKDFVPVDCNQVLEQTLRTLQLAIAETQAEITLDSLPTLQADPNQLNQLFQNLITNALKFQRSGTIPQIHISVQPQETTWLFQVRDNGIGIKPQYLDRIFEVFKRLHTRREYPGTGIGLAICKKIVLRHGGEIWAESEPGLGTTFCFTLPATLPTPNPFS